MSKTKKPTKLPDKPSALIRLALRDLEKCERSRYYKVAMDDWHEPNGVCKVCLAGAVMAKSLGADRTKSLTPSRITGDCDEDWGRLMALNSFRQGLVAEGFDYMKIYEPTPVRWIPVVPYATKKSFFKRDMRRLATMLAKEGL